MHGVAAVCDSLGVMGVTSDLEGVLASLYEAAVVREKWPTALQNLADLCGSRGALITRGDRSHDGLICSPGLGPTVAQFFEQEWHLNDYRTHGAMPKINGGFVADQHIITHDEIARSEYYRSFAAPAGVPWFAAGGLDRVDGVALAFSLQRSDKEGPFSKRDLQRLNMILPRLREVLCLTYRINTDRERALLAGLDLIDQAAVLVDRHGLVKNMNGAAEALVGSLLTVRAKRLLACGPGLQAAMTDWIDSACSASAQSASIGRRVIRLEDTSGRIWMGQALPVAAEACDIFGGGHAVLIFMPAHATHHPSEALLSSAFNLTPAEARVARAHDSVRHELVRRRRAHMAAGAQSGTRLDIVGGKHPVRDVLRVGTRADELPPHAVERRAGGRPRGHRGEHRS